MKKFLPVFGVAAACSVCCAPLLLPLLSGFAGSSLGILFGWEAAVLAGIAIAAVVVFVLLSRQATAVACDAASNTATSGSSCGGDCATAKRGAV